MDDYVTSGMVVGLGTGSTAAFAGKGAVIVVAAAADGAADAAAAAAFGVVIVVSKWVP